jgi:UDP-N-acetyl-D-mannosaminuronic acid transferase (WecB/TagA/CpsF family)
MHDTKQKDSILHGRVKLPGHSPAASNARATLNRRRPQSAVELLKPAVAPHGVAVVAIVVIASENIATEITQPDVMVAVLTAASEPACDTFLYFVGGQRT